MNNVLVIYEVLKKHQSFYRTKTASFFYHADGIDNMLNTVPEHLKYFIEHGMFTPEEKAFLNSPASSVNVIASPIGRAMVRGGLGAALGAALGDSTGTGAVVGGVSGGLGSLVLSNLMRLLENNFARQSLKNIKDEIVYKLINNPGIHSADIVKQLGYFSPISPVKDDVSMLRNIALTRNARRVSPLNVLRTREILRTPLALGLTSLPAVGLYNALSD